jgi:hypothetical protein
MSLSDSQNRRRSQRVLLEVVVFIILENREGDRVRAQGFTQVVNAHGGLMDVPFRMVAGQRLTLINPQTGKEARCRVVRVDRPRDGSFATAFEFDERSPQFWPISFPPPDWGAVQEITTERRK